MDTEVAVGKGIELDAVIERVVNKQCLADIALMPELVRVRSWPQLSIKKLKPNKRLLLI
jgi:hypothetical protein